jgi:hypothetical protein
MSCGYFSVTVTKSGSGRYVIFTTKLIDTEESRELAIAALGDMVRHTRITTRASRVMKATRSFVEGKR